MRISSLGIDRKKTVVILGAGASRGAKCFEEHLLPAPLDVDFFSLMERVQHKEESLRKLLQFVKEEFGETSFPRMEELFTQMEALSEFHEHLTNKPGARIRRYRRQLEEFVGSVACFFRHVFIDPKTGKHRVCEYHDRLADLLHADDVILSFNYDCLVDDALRRRAGRSWNPRQGYGVGFSAGNVDAWRPEITGAGRLAKNPILLLKLHGSLNWDRSAGKDPRSLKLRADPYEDGARVPAEVVPPVWDKTISKDPVLKGVWKQARTMLPTGPVLIVAGYSAPQTDLLSQALIRVSASERARNQKRSHVIVVNPTDAARRRMLELIKGGMNSATTVVELDGMRDLQRLLA